MTWRYDISFTLTSVFVQVVHNSYCTNFVRFVRPGLLQEKKAESMEQLLNDLEDKKRMLELEKNAMDLNSDSLDVSCQFFYLSFLLQSRALHFF